MPDRLNFPAPPVSESTLETPEERSKRLRPEWVSELLGRMDRQTGLLTSIQTSQEKQGTTLSAQGLAIESLQKTVYEHAKQIEELRSSPRREPDALWRAFGIGGLVLAVVYAWILHSQPAPALQHMHSPPATLEE
jgi:hypothetical protein